jgi:hypothetical protein
VPNRFRDFGRDGSRISENAHAQHGMCRGVFLS